MSSLKLKTAAICLVVCLLLGCLTGCVTPEPGVTTTEPKIEAVDYAAAAKLKMNSYTRKQEVTVKNFVDGDTVHFHVPTDVMPGGVLKARFLAINTPESTGKIEEYGKAASNFTKEKLKNAVSIVLESDTAEWNKDSTGDRYLVWVWYKPAEGADYRNLNLEILQNGLAIASNAADNIYGSMAMSAIAQAKALKLNVHSEKPDPDFFYGDAVELDLKELRTNTAAYSGKKVAFTGVVALNYNNGVYVEQYDPETDMYYGMYAYYGFGFGGVKMLRVGNEVRIVGTVSEYNGSWQVSGLSYSDFLPSADHVQLISQGNEIPFRLTQPSVFAEGTVQVSFTNPETDEVTTETYPYAQAALGTSISMKNLLVVDVYTTDDEESSSKGAMTLTCECDGATVSVRTTVLLDDNGALITADAYLGKTIDVMGIVDYYDGTYQIKVFSANDITIHN